MEPHSLIFAGNLFLDVLGQSMVCCLKGAELLLHEFTAKMAVDSKDVPLNSIGGRAPQGDPCAGAHLSLRGWTLL